MVGRLSTNGDFSGPVLTLLRSSQQPRSHIPQVTFGSLPMGWCPVGKPAASAGAVRFRIGWLHCETIFRAPGVFPGQACAGSLRARTPLLYEAHRRNIASM